jgi:threonine dehydrogenase-like Zn-dependent dehydrogenase
VRALLLERLPHRFAAARAASSVLGSGRGVGVGPLRLVELEPPRLPGPGWHRVRPLLAGICGSDLATLDGASSRWFEPIVSFPFVPGHEVVGVVEGGPLDGRRVVLEPVLGCVARDVHPPCPACAAGRKGACERIAFGHLRPGLQTGYCADTGGGWSESFVAHESQLHAVPEELSDEDAVMIEPAACAVHAALAAGVGPGDRVVVLGAGTLGLCCVAALRQLALPAGILVTAKHDVQRQLAGELGADAVAEPDELATRARSPSPARAARSSASPAARRW